MTLPWPYVAIAALAVVVAVVWPLSPALPSADLLGSKIAACVVAVVVCGAFVLLRTPLRAGRMIWISAAALAGLAAIAVLAVHIDASASCTATYDAKPAIVGRALQPYVHPEPGSSADSLLFDAAGVAESVWLPSSVRLCRWELGWIGMSAVPLFVVAGCCLLQLTGPRVLALATPPLRGRQAGAAHPIDAFFSYRHCEPDRTFTLDLLERLEQHGVRTAIDERDFRPNEHFLSEMERCIRESRFVLCIVTARYVESDHCNEEAVLSKTFDMSERTRRVVPLIFERVELPVWLHGIVGIDFTGASFTDGFEKLRALVQVK